MSTPNLPSPGPPLGATMPPLPPGWLANWSPEQNSWYYIFTATGATQWEYPNAPLDYQAPPVYEPQYSPSAGPELPPTDKPSSVPGVEGVDQPVPDGDRGLGKTALAMGSGFLAATSLGHKFGEVQNHHDHNHGFGKMAQTIAAAGAGAIGTKMFGLFKNKPQSNYQQAPPPQSQPQPQVHVYPVYMPGPPGAPPQGPPIPPPVNSPSYHGQPPPMGANYGHTAAPGATIATPNMGTPAPVYHQGGFGMGSFAPQSGPPLHIYGAVFADRDVTQVVRGLVTPQQVLSLQGEKLVEQFGDPWPEAGRKMFNVLYSYGDRPMELVVADTTTANIEIKHEAISKMRMEFCQPPSSRIIACVWGLENALTRSRIEQLEKDGEMDGSLDVLGAAGFWNWEPRTLVCYYRTESAGIAMVYCREGGTIRLPWNPLAKWS